LSAIHGRPFNLTDAKMIEFGPLLFAGCGNQFLPVQEFSVLRLDD